MVGRSSARLRQLVSALAIVSVLAALAVAVARSPGNTVRSLDLNDAGVWVTNDHAGVFGRLNRAAGALDGGFFSPGGARAEGTATLDVVQDGAAVVAVDRTTSTIFPVDVRAGTPIVEQQVPIAEKAVIQLRAGSIAVLDPASGSLWATRFSDAGTRRLQLRDLSVHAVPLTKLTPAPDPKSANFADLAVTVRGTVIAADATGKTVTLTPSGSGFAAPVQGKTGARKGIAVTTVDEAVVFADPQVGTVQVGDGQILTSPSTPIVLQEPSAAAPDVVLASPQSLMRVDLRESKLTPIFSAGTGEPARPVVVRGCAFGAWAGQEAVVARSCGGAPATEQSLDRTASLGRPVFRVNRGQVVVNDVADGRLFDVEQRRSTDEWLGLLRPLRASLNLKDRDVDPRNATSNQPPTIRSRPFGARPGRATVIHVLDNVSDLAGRILAVSKIEKVTGGSAVVAPDLQSVIFTLDAKARSAGFEYTVNAGGRSATGHATVIPKLKGNAAPKRSKAVNDPAWTVPVGGFLSLPVLAAWRDDDGDALTIANASATEGSARATSEGTIEMTAPAQGGTVEITYTVTDGRATSAATRTRVEVQAVNAATSKSAVARPDVAVGTPGVPVTIRPLVNDLAGSDPADATAHLALAGDVTFARSSKRPLTVETDVDAGTVVATARKPGTYLLAYRAAYGSAEPAVGNIRLEIREDDATRTPVTMPDSVSVRGLTPVLVDVLSNDRDPSGGVLTVQSAAPLPADSISVAVVGGRWLRIVPTGVVPKEPPLITYRVSNGRTAAEGQVAVSLIKGRPTDQVFARSDSATVRAGDSILVDVLDNDSSLAGAALTLQADVPDAPGAGRLRVTDPLDPENADVGAGYVSGQSIRYLAPTDVASARTVTVDYVAVTETGESGSGRLVLTLEPAPTPEKPNEPPRPEAVEARVVQGDTVTIPISTSGHDHDGDSTVVSGLASAPRLGRLVGFSPNSLTYQAYPNMRGTDTFRYSVTDRFGASATATVRISVVPPGDPQIAVPIPDSITAAPGARVTLNPLSNDLFAKGDPVVILDLAQNNPELASGVTLTGPQGPLTATAPPLGQQILVNYGLVGNAGPSGLSTISIRSAEGVRIPPRITDHVATATAVGSATVDVLSTALDPDGSSERLKVVSVADPAATVSGGTVDVPVTDAPQAIPYVVRDASGSEAAAVIYVPPAGSGGPFHKPGTAVSIAQGESKRLRLSDYIASPTGSPVQMSSASSPVLASPPDAIVVSASRAGSDAVVVAAKGDYAGPAALMVWVTDEQATGSAPSPRATLVSIPVQIGDDAPVLRCPSKTIDLVGGAEPITLDISSLCHVWTSDPAAANRLAYDFAWEEEASGVLFEGSGSGQLLLSAGVNARAGAQGRLRISVQGAKSRPATIEVRVAKELPPPTIAPIRLDHARAGEPLVVDLAQAMTSPIPDAQFTVLGVTAPDQVGVTLSGSRLTVTPTANAKGVLSIYVRATDSPGNPDRVVEGTVTISIFGPPDPPTNVAARISDVSASVTLAWIPGSANGSPIDYYEVSGVGDAVRCAASPCTLSGLPVGREVSFSVRAHNEAGLSDPSAPSPPVMVDEVPGPPANLRATEVGDGVVALGWSPATSTGSPVSGYIVSVSPGVSGGSQSLGANATTATIAGLSNGTAYEFTLYAVNDAGRSVAVSTSATPVGPPSAPVIEAIRWSDSGDGARAIADIAWSASTPNGPGGVSYSATMDGTSICVDVTALACTSPPVPYGQEVTFAVRASNSAGLTTDSDAASDVPVGTPGDWSAISAAVGSDESSVVLQFDVPATHGPACPVTLIVDGGVSGSLGTYGPGATPGQSHTVSDLRPGTHTFQLQLCDGGPTSNTVSVNLTGPLQTPVVSASGSADSTIVNFSVTVPEGLAGRDAATLVVSVAGSGPSQQFAVTGEGPYTGSFDIGAWETEVTILAQVNASDGSSGQGSATTTTGSQPLNPTLSLTRGEVVPDGINEGCTPEAPCNYLVIEAHDFPGDSVTCTFTGTGVVSEPSAVVPVGVPAQVGVYSNAPDLVASCDGVAAGW